MHAQCWMIMLMLMLINWINKFKFKMFIEPIIEYGAYNYSGSFGVLWVHMAWDNNYVKTVESDNNNNTINNNNISYYYEIEFRKVKIHGNCRIPVLIIFIVVVIIIIIGFNFGGITNTTSALTHRYTMLNNLIFGEWERSCYISSNAAEWHVGGIYFVYIKPDLMSGFKLFAMSLTWNDIPRAATSDVRILPYTCRHATGLNIMPVCDVISWTPSIW